MLVGITGPSGAGKGCVVSVFAGRGFEVIDADEVARDVVMPGEPALEALAEEFGRDIILPDGTLDRRLLAGRAFASRESTDSLNRIMHTEIIRRMTERAEKCAASGRHCLFDAPLLIEAGLDRICDARVAVIAPLGERVSRLMRRDGLTEREILARISRQHDDGYYTSQCEYVIVNDGDRMKLEKEAEQTAEEVLKRHGNG